MPSPSKENSERKRAPSFRETVDRWCERVILWLVLAILVLGPLGYGAVRGNPYTVPVPHIYPLLAIQGLTMLALVFWVVRFYTLRPFWLLWPPIC